MSGTIHLKKWLSGQVATAKAGYAILHVDANGRLRILNDDGTYTSFAVETVNGMTGDVVIDLNSLGGMTIADALELIADNPGPKGDDGDDAYEVAVAAGFSGTVLEWLASFEGKDAYQVAVEQGFSGTVLEWLDEIEGADGKSAYEVALANGFVGTEEEWLDSLPGKSAYQSAVDNGFIGTEAEWIESIGGNAVTPGQDTEPPTDPNNKLWFDPNELRLKFRYTDEDSTQWVDANPAGLSGGSSSGSAIVPLEPAQYAGSVLTAIPTQENMANCAWSTLWEVTETNIYPASNAITNIDGSYNHYSGSEANEYGYRIIKLLVYVNSTTTLSLINQLRVKNTNVLDPYNNYGYLSLYDCEIVKDDGTVEQRKIMHNAHQKGYLAAYIDSVVDPDGFDNIFREATILTKTLTVGTYLINIKLDFKNDSAFCVDEIFHIETDGGNATLTIVGESGQAHREPQSL